MECLNIMSLNVNGLRNDKKRKTLFKKFREQKLDIVCLQETYITDDKVNQWEREWGGQLIYSVGTARSRGQLILLNKTVSGFEIIHSTDRLIVILIEFNSSKICICNGYAPNANQAIENYFNDTTDFLTNIDCEKIVFCGDLNSVLSNEMDIISGDNHSTLSVENFQNFCHVNNLLDAWRLFNNDAKEFTWSRVINGSLIARRLDYILISETVLDFSTECRIISFPQSDHRGVCLKISAVNVKKGPGYWKINNSILKEQPFLDLINNTIDEFITDQRYSNLDGDTKWELLKLRIREDTMNYSQFRAASKRNHRIGLQVELDKLDNLLALKPNDVNLLNRKIMIRTELEIAEMEKTKSAQIRSKLKWIDEGDKNTKFFLNLEKSRANAKIIPELELEDGTKITDQMDILKAQKDYYENLYRKNDNARDGIEQLDGFLGNSDFPTLSQEQSASCEGRVTLEELSKGLQGLNNGSSPGLDGLTTEFMKVFWGRLGGLLVDSFNSSYAKGTLTYSQNTATITLIHKGKDLAKNKLTNWRPISLTNTDYKILAKSLAIRLGKVIETIVDKDQVAYVKGRKVSDNLRLIDDIIDYLKEKNKPGLLLAIDFSKAFDSISRKFMFNSFRRFGFGEDFVKWVEILMGDTRSCIGYNGWVSGSFKVEKGIRQGCPFSPLAFIIALEFLAIKIRNVQDINGIKIDKSCQLDLETFIKILLYADDVTLLLKDRNELELALKILDDYKQVSGLQINKQKTEVMWLGSNIGNAFDGLGLKWVNEIKILGIYFSNDRCASELDKNWKGRIMKMKGLIKTWEKRNLSLLGKICIIKSFLLSQFIYVMQCLVLPENILSEINTILYRFLWRRKDSNKKAFEKVKRKTLTSNYEMGGLKMVNVILLQQSFLCEWLVKISKSSDTDKWSWIPKSMFSLFGKGCSFLNFPLDLKEFKGLELVKSVFWKHTIKVWLTNNKIRSEDGNKLRQCLWNNHNIVYNNKVIHFVNWAEKGITFVDQLLRNNVILTLDEIGQLVGRTASLPLEYIVVRNAVLAFIRNNPAYQTQNYQNVNLIFNNNVFCHSRQFKSFLIDHHYLPPISNRFWLNKFGVHLNEKYWQLSFDTCKESRLRELNWKVLNNIYPTNILLHKMGLAQTNKCSSCPDLIDFVEHFFFHCPVIKPVWNSVENRFFITVSKNIVISPQDALLGIVEKDGFSSSMIKMINHLILIAKMCIGKYRYGKQVDINIMFDFECKIRGL